MEYLVKTQVEGLGECEHWNEKTLGFLGKVVDALEARVDMRRRRA